MKNIVFAILFSASLYGQQAAPASKPVPAASPSGPKTLEEANKEIAKMKDDQAKDGMRQQAKASFEKAKSAYLQGVAQTNQLQLQMQQAFESVSIAFGCPLQLNADTYQCPQAPAPAK